MDEVNYDALKVWLDLLQWIVVIGVGIYSWVTARRRRHVQEIEDAHKRLAAVERRVQSLEQSLEHLPTHQDMQQLARRIDGVSGDLREIKGSLSGLGRAVDLMNQHLLGTGGQKA